MANGHNMGVKGSVRVSFKIGPCSFTHKFIVCEGLNRPFISGEEFFSNHCSMLGWTDENKMFAEYREDAITVVSQAVMDEKIVVVHPVRILAGNFAMMSTKCPNMFSGTVGACPYPKFKKKFKNLYLEPMQYSNPDGKWQDVVPNMIINLYYDRDIYISKNTIVAYALESDKSCEYL